MNLTNILIGLAAVIINSYAAIRALDERKSRWAFLFLVLACVGGFVVVREVL